MLDDPKLFRAKNIGRYVFVAEKGKPFGSFHPLDGKSHCISANGMTYKTYIYSVYNIYVQKIRYT